MLLAFNKPFGVLSQFTPDGSPNRPLAEFRFPKEVYAIGRLDADSEGLLLFTDEPGLNTRLLHPRHAHEREYWAQVERIPTPEALAKLSQGLVIQGHQTLPCRAWLLEPQPVMVDAPTPHPSQEGNSIAGRIRNPAPLLGGVGGGLPQRFTGRDKMKDTPIIPPRNPPIRVRQTVPDCWIGLELIEGKNRQVRRMTAAIGHPTLRLLRVRIGQFTLGELPPGQWRELNAAERQQVLG